MRRALLVVALLALSWVPLAGAQSAGNGIAIAVSPGSGQAYQGETVEALLTLSNTRNVTVTLSLSHQAQAAVSVAFSTKEVVLHPGQMGTVTTTLTAAQDAMFGDHPIRFFAAADNWTVNVDYVLTVVQRPLPDPVAPETPERVDVTSVRNRVVEYSVSVRNPAAFAQDFMIQWSYPAGWESRGGPAGVLLGAGETTTLTFAVVPLDHATDGVGALVVRNRTAASTTDVHLSSPAASFTVTLAPQVAQVAPGDTVVYSLTATATRPVMLDLRSTFRPGFDITVDPPTLVVEPGRGAYATVTVVADLAGDGIDSIIDINATARDTLEEHMATARIEVRTDPAAPTPELPPSDAPGEDAHEDPSAAQASPSVSSDPSSALATPRLLLVVEPSDVVVTVGSRGEGTVRIVWEGDYARTLTLTMEMPPFLRGDFDTTLEIGPRATLEIPFTVALDNELPRGATYSARVLAATGEEANFRIVIGASAGGLVQQTEDGARLDLGLAFGIAAAGAGAAGVAAIGTRKRWPLALSALYARLLPARVLAHPKRSRMLDEVRAQPGLTVGELQRRLKLANGALAHHLHMLERAGHVASVTDGQQRRLFPTGMPRAAPVAPLPDRLVAILRERGAVEAGAVARELGVTRQALHYHVKKLAASGAIRVRLEAGENVLELATVPAHPRP